MRQWKQSEIVAWLADNKDIHVNPRTLRRRLQEWGSHQVDRTEDSEQLRNRIQFMFCRIGASDDEMLQWLKDESFQITLRGLVRIRKEHGLKR